MVKVRVPATTANFGPGFDCMGAALELFNEIQMEFDISCHVEIKGEGEGQLPLNEDNLVYRAAQRVLSELGIDKSLNIKCDNNIPLARGLGSSAACIAGGMMAANRLTDDKLPLKRIIELAVEMEGHPDNVLPALVGGFTISMMREGNIIYKKYALPETLLFVVGIPKFHLKTEQAREVLPRQLPLKDAVFNIGSASLLAASLATGDLENIDEFFKDRIHQPHRSKLIPGLETILAEAYNKGALGCFLSGSGPSVICLSDKDNASIIGEFIKDCFYEKGIQANYKILSPSIDGVKFI